MYRKNLVCDLSTVKLSVEYIIQFKLFSDCTSYNLLGIWGPRDLELPAQ